MCPYTPRNDLRNRDRVSRQNKNLEDGMMCPYTSRNAYLPPPCTQRTKLNKRRAWDRHWARRGKVSKQQTISLQEAQNQAIRTRSPTLGRKYLQGGGMCPYTQRSKIKQIKRGAPPWAGRSFKVEGCVPTPREQAQTNKEAKQQTSPALGPNFPRWKEKSLHPGTQTPNSPRWKEKSLHPGHHHRSQLC